MSCVRVHGDRIFVGCSASCSVFVFRADSHEFECSFGDATTLEGARALAFDEVGRRVFVVSGKRANDDPHEAIAVFALD